MRRLVWGIGLRFVLALSSAHVNANGSAGAGSVPTFTKDVAPIVFAKCVSCHRPGEVAPMSLLTFNDVRPWAKAIRAKVVTREMPPWGADPRYGTFANDRSLTPEQIETIVAWVDAGAPKGNDVDMPAPPPVVAGWLAGSEPDHIIEMPVEYHVPAEGELNMLNFYVPVPFKEDRFTRLLEWRPGNRTVVHHGTANVGDLPAGARVDTGGELILADGTRENDLTATSQQRVTGKTFNLIVDYVPGRYAIPAPSLDLGFRIPAGKYLKFNVHYQASGRPETDRSRIGLWFNSKSVVQELYREGVGKPLPSAVDRTEFYRVEGVTEMHDPATGRAETGWPPLAPFADNYTVVAATPITESITLYGFTPHMHLRGKDMAWFLTLPDGRQETLLSVPNYDFNWQTYYELGQPRKIPAGSTISSVAHYNNTPKNKYNPAPSQQVFWSEQSWDEMFIAFMTYAVDSEDPKLKTNHKSDQP